MKVFNLLSFSSFLWDLTATLVLFVIAIVLAFSIRFILFASKQQQTPIEPVRKKQPKKVAPKTKSIVINPDEIGRIYVKKN